MISVLVVCLCLVVSSNIVKSSVTAQSSSVVLTGERVELKCSVTVNDTASWAYMYSSWNSSTETYIYLGRDDIVTSMRSRYKIDKNISGQHNLIIDSVDLAHAGRYRCTAVQQPLVNDVQLIVLGSQPVCSGNTSETDVAKEEQRRLHLCLWCSINYTGNGFPVFSWTKSNAEKNITANTTTSGTGQVPFTSTSLITQQLHTNDSGITFFCRITFQTLDISPENAFNVFQYKWNYTLGNSTPFYRWTDVKANTPTDVPAYVGNHTTEKGHTLEFTAVNIFVLVKNYTIKGRAQDSGVTSGVSNSHIGLTTLATAGSLLALLIITVAFSCVVYRKRLRGDSNVGPDVALTTDLNSYRPDGDVYSANEVYTDVCKPRGSSSGVYCDNEVYSEVCDSRGSDSISFSEFYADVCEPTGPSDVIKGNSIGDNSRSPQIPTRERKDLIGADGIEHVGLREVKPPDRKGGRHVKSVMW